VLHQLDGCDHTGANCSVGVPAILGMNFQGVNIAQKFSGYVDAAGTTGTGTAAPGGNDSAIGMRCILDANKSHLQANATQRAICRRRRQGESPKKKHVRRIAHMPSPGRRRQSIPQGFRSRSSLRCRAQPGYQTTRGSSLARWYSQAVSAILFMS